ncbi:MAG: S1C family serine protease, partial [Gammaproteobacteria bacterium]|nr:S1C family serine protease [Gammaproteobacteria bacterium]
SGGPLLDSAGRLVGINTAIYSPSGAYAGIGFAVPVDTVNKVVPQLISQGEYLRPGLGIIVDADLNRRITRRLGTAGVLILSVQAGSGAAAAGLRGSRTDRRGALIPGDIIVAVNGDSVDSVAGLQLRLDDYSPGDEVILSVVRDGKELKVPVVLQRER